MSSAPITMEWNGEAMVPASPFWAARADRQFVVGEVYKIVEHHDRSEASHNHYFASIANAWNTLTDEMLAEYPTPEHLRKKMLVKCGYADERSIVCASKADAERMAAFVKPMDAYAVVIHREAVVKVFTAQSQSMKAMGKREFQESKTAVLEAIDKLLGVEPGETARAAA
ncbi:hypothetical protein [Ochrobactrum chromiisoli]|uniref:Uncharacterized protein n=1 Tax=Ochrobactrum chromiisoli TaxID=2993941 RepID=A0ABT3QUW4_9HYPH|nr:hypothetical protein [Ochrobactrum chromiisoli]MCX2699359.1 hypothetical protein [Ochrobactrum chromiisoli]